jgi:phytoene dehydrogenase-like protein
MLELERSDVAVGQLYGMRRERYDAVVVGSGPNGLGAAIELARSGLGVLVVEAKPTIGGGMRTSEATLPGYRHDICSAIHPMGAASPFLRRLPLERYGLEWIHPPTLAAQAMDDGTVQLFRSVEETARALGADQQRYLDLFAPIVKIWSNIESDVLGPFGIPKHPIDYMRFGLRAPWAAAPFLKLLFKTEYCKALLAGVAAHSTLPLEWMPSFSAALVLTTAGHLHGWPIAKGGSQSIADAMAGYLLDLGGEIQCDFPVSALAELPSSRLRMLDITPRQFLDFPEIESQASGWYAKLYREQLRRFVHGPGSFKVDYALSGPIPWRDPACLNAGTVHLGGTMDEIAESERLVWNGQLSQRPYVLVAQQSLFDPTRAPGQNHTCWAYCHVPHGYQESALDVLEAQIERFAPGFKDVVLKRATINPQQMQIYNPNYIGGDISGGSVLLRQLLTRPVVSFNPYATPLPGVYLCSSSTPPGGGVHGMCGYQAARSALKWLKK